MAAFQIPSSSEITPAVRRAIDAAKKFGESTFLPLTGGTVTGAITATEFVGGGVGLTGLNASNLGSGTVPSARISGTYANITGIGTIGNSPTFTSTGTITASPITGLQILNNTAGNDAFLTLHVAGDFAGYFGIGGAENDLVVGGFSYGGNRYRVYHSGNISALTLPALTSNSNITGSRLKTSSNQIDIGSWAANGVYGGIFKPDGAANNYLLMADTGSTFVSTPSAGGAIYLRPGLNNTAGQVIITTSGLNCNTLSSDASNNLTLQAGGANVLVSPSGSLTAIASTAGYQAVHWGTTFGNYARFTSRRALKENITPIVGSGAIIDALRPVTFIPKATCEETDELRYLREQDVQYGFIAEEVAEVADGKLTVWEPDDELYAVPVVWKQYDMIALVVAEVKDLRARVTFLENSCGT